MSAVGEYVHDVWSASASIFEGLVVTMANFLRKPITIQYPDRTATPVVDTLPERYRGFLEVDVNRCTACKLCEQACPVQCIAIGIEKNAEGQRGLTEFAIDIGKCMYCGLCTEPCPTDAIRMTREFEAASPQLDTLVMRYVPEGAFVIPAKAKAALELPTPPRGELARKAVARAIAEAPSLRAVLAARRARAVDAAAAAATPASAADKPSEPPAP